MRGRVCFSKKGSESNCKLRTVPTVEWPGTWVLYMDLKDKSENASLTHEELIEKSRIWYIEQLKAGTVSLPSYPRVVLRAFRIEVPKDAKWVRNAH